MNRFVTWMQHGVLAALLLTPALASAEAPRFFDLEGFGQFLDGNPESTAVTEEGAVVLAPTTRERFAEPAAVFSAATARGDEVIVARVDDGSVISIDRAGKTKTLFTAEETLVTALLAVGSNLYVATAEPAKVYKVERGGKARVFHVPDANYIWGLAVSPTGTIYAVTGEPGSVIAIDGKGNGEVIFAPNQEHLRSILYDKYLGLFVGGGERGVLYRSPKAKEFRALYDTGHPEITSIVVHGNYAYVAGVTGADALVSEQSEEKPGKKASAEVRSQLVQVAMDGAAEVLAGSNDEAVFALGVNDQGRILVATGATGREDPRGRLYTVAPERRLITLQYQTASRRLTHLVPLPRGAIAAVAADGGRLIHITGGFAKKGEFFTLPYDTGINSRFGVVQAFGVWPKGTRVTVAARTGQTEEPDDSWSPWSKESAASGGRPQVPNGRYVQVRLTLHGDGKVSPEVQRVRMAYLRQNLPPFVREVVALRKGLALLPMQQESAKSKTISLNAKTEDDDKRKNGNGDDKPKSKRARQVERRGALTVKWVAEDPNGDSLRYDLSYRSLGRGEWKVMEKELDNPFYTMSSAQLPDGHYQFRVRVTDAPSNPDGYELDDTRESRAILVDNTAPRLDPLDVTTQGGRVTVRAVVADAVGPITTAEYSLDGGDFRPMLPDDGVLDGSGETFTIRLGQLAAGAHTITVRVTDEAENEGYAETRW